MNVASGVHVDVKPGDITNPLLISAPGTASSKADMHAGQRIYSVFLQLQRPSLISSAYIL